MDTIPGPEPLWKLASEEKKRYMEEQAVLEREREMAAAAAQVEPADRNKQAFPEGIMPAEDGGSGINADLAKLKEKAAALRDPDQDRAWTGEHGEAWRRRNRYMGDEDMYDEYFEYYGDDPYANYPGDTGDDSQQDVFEFALMLVLCFTIGYLLYIRQFRMLNN